MNERGIEEIISTLYEMVQDARNVPLSSDKCMIERDRVLDLLDEISNMMPGELKQARTIVESRSEVINNAKREAESILKQAQAQARQLVTEEEIYKQAEQESADLIAAAEEKIRQLKAATNEFVDDALRRTETSIGESLNEIRDARSRFSNLLAPQKEMPIVEEQ